MNFIDVMGAPGVGKSTLLDDLWPPRAIVGDGTPPAHEWAEFLVCAYLLLDQCRRHPTHDRCASMMKRSFTKMAAVAARNDPRTYIQTGFAQRGLGLGWRLEAIDASSGPVAEYYRLMPVSLGVVILKAPVDLIQHRNVARGKDRSHMVPHMVRSLEIAEDVLRARKVPVQVIDTTRPVEHSRGKLLHFAETLGAVLPEGEAA